MKPKNNLPELISTTLSQLADGRRSLETVNGYKWTYGKLKRFCAKNHIEYYDESIGEQFLNTYEVRQTQISKGTIKNYRRHIQRLNCTLAHVDWIPGGGRPPVEYASSCYDVILEEYEAYLYKSGKSRKDVRRRAHLVSCFLKFAEQRKILTLSSLSATDIYAAFQDSTDKGNFRRLVNAFLNYAHKYKLTDSDLTLFMPSVVRHQAIPSVYSPAEVEEMLDSIDRSTKIGKRDYVIVLIAARLGLRASDIAEMTFACLHEPTSTIRIIQEKTKCPLTLPLLDEIKIALSEYINDARPVSHDDHIFLNMTGFGAVSPSNVGHIVKRAFVRSGLERGKRRIGSHSLRASLATALLDEGNDYATIQQVLGQTDIQSTKPYVKAGIEKLRINALPVPPPIGNFKNLIAGGGEQ